MLHYFQKFKRLFLGNKPMEECSECPQTGFSPSLACILTAQKQDEILVGLEALVEQLIPSSRLFVFTGADITKRAIQRLDTILASLKSRACCGERLSFGEQKEILASRWGEGFSKMIDLDEDTEAREEYEGYINEDVLFKPLSLCLIPDVPHYLIIDPTQQLKLSPTPLYREFLSSDEVVRGMPLTEELVSLPENSSESEEEDRDEEEGVFSAWDGLIFVNRARFCSLLAPLREDLTYRVGSKGAGQSLTAGDQSTKKKRANLAKQARLTKISENILANWRYDAHQALPEQAFAFLRAVTTASVGWHSVVFPAFHPRNFATVETTDEFFEALAALSAGKFDS